MIHLSTIEQGLQQELLAQGVENLVTDFMQTAKSYGLPTSEEEATRLLILVAETKLKQLETLDTLELEEKF